MVLVWFEGVLVFCFALNLGRGDQLLNFTLIERKTVIDLRKAVMELAVPLTEPGRIYARVCWCVRTVLNITRK